MRLKQSEARSQRKIRMQNKRRRLRQQEGPPSRPSLSGHNKPLPLLFKTNSRRRQWKNPRRKPPRAKMSCRARIFQRHGSRALSHQGQQEKPRIKGLLRMHHSWRRHKISTSRNIQKARRPPARTWTSSSKSLWAQKNWPPSSLELKNLRRGAAMFLTSMAREILMLSGSNRRRLSTARNCRSRAARSLASLRSRKPLRKKTGQQATAERRVGHLKKLVKRSRIQTKSRKNNWSRSSKMMPERTKTSEEMNRATLLGNSRRITPERA